jgi:four helix bundle protein
MNENTKKVYDLERRTFVFTKNVIEYIKELPKGMTNYEIGKQLMRSAASVGANYIEANEALSKKDFVMRVKICRKEAKETIYWLELSSVLSGKEEDKIKLVNECTELMKIFAAIIHKVKI